jgi:prefoldin subunit 5
MLLEHIAGQVENIEKEMEGMRNNTVNLNRAMEDINKIEQTLEVIKDKVRKNGNH